MKRVKLSWFSLLLLVATIASSVILYWMMQSLRMDRMPYQLAGYLILVWVVVLWVLYRELHGTWNIFRSNQDDMQLKGRSHRVMR